MINPENFIPILEGEKKRTYQPKKKQQQFFESVSSVTNVSSDDEILTKPYDMHSEDLDSRTADTLVKYIDGSLENDSINWDEVAVEITKNSSVLYLLSQNLYRIRRKIFEGANKNPKEKDTKERFKYVFMNIKDIIIAMVISNKISFLENLDDFFWHQNVIEEVMGLADPEEKKLLMEHLVKILNPKSMFRLLAYESSQRMYSHTYEDDSDKILMFIKFMVGNESTDYQDYIRQMLFAKGIQPIEIKDLMDESFVSISDQSIKIIKTLDKSLTSDYPHDEEYISVSFLKNELARIFNVPKKLFESWHFYDSRDTNSLITRLGFMEQIEIMIKGGVQLLYDNYGICEFNRYPLGMLIDQIKKHHEQIPYGIIIYPKSDHNNAFDEDLNLLFSLYEQIGDKYLVRFFECGNGQDVYRSLSNLDHKYGKENKISFMILAGHGQANSIQLGDEIVSSGSFTSLEKDMIADSRGLNRAKDFFVSSPQVVLFSCSTGVKDGIAEELSKKLEARVVAPTVPTSPKTIQFIENEEGQIYFDVKYYDGGKPALYVSN